MRAMDADKSGVGLGLPVLVALCGSLLGKNTRGGTIVVGAMNLDYRRLARPPAIFTAVALQVIMLVAVLFTDRSHNAHRWFHLGFATFQPAEFSKVVLVVFLAYFLELRREAVNDWKHTLAPIALIAGVSVVLVLKEPDLGTSLALALIVATMLFVAGLRLSYFAYGALGAVPMFYVLISHVSYRYNRLLAFLDPYADPQGKGFQIIQSTIAVGTGGIDGVGLMEGLTALGHNRIINSIVYELNHSPWQF